MTQAKAETGHEAELARRPMGPDFVRLFYDELERTIGRTEDRGTGLAVALIVHSAGCPLVTGD